MKSSTSNVLLVAAALLLASFSEGCTVATGVWPIPQSHFAYPNSNVIPLGQGQGKADTISLGMPDIMDPDLMEQAVQDAIKQKGGDLLLDYDLSMEIKQYIPFVYSISWKAEGTVARMEIGKQKLQ